MPPTFPTPFLELGVQKSLLPSGCQGREDLRPPYLQGDALSLVRHPPSVQIATVVGNLLLGGRRGEHCTEISSLTRLIINSTCAFVERMWVLWAENGRTPLIYYVHREFLSAPPRNSRLIKWRVFVSGFCFAAVQMSFSFHTWLRAH